MNNEGIARAAHRSRKRLTLRGALAPRSLCLMIPGHAEPYHLNQRPSYGRSGAIGSHTSGTWHHAASPMPWASCPMRWARCPFFRFSLS